jgi:hypothetical protein
MWQSDDMEDLKPAVLFVIAVCLIVGFPILIAVIWSANGPCVEATSTDGSCSNRQHRMVREPGVTLCRCHDVPAVGSARP